MDEIELPRCMIRSSQDDTKVEAKNKVQLTTRLVLFETPRAARIFNHAL